MYTEPDNTADTAVPDNLSRRPGPGVCCCSPDPTRAWDPLSHDARPCYADRRYSPRGVSIVWQRLASPGAGQRPVSPTWRAGRAAVCDASGSSWRWRLA